MTTIHVAIADAEDLNPPGIFPHVGSTPTPGTILVIFISARELATQHFAN